MQIAEPDCANLVVRIPDQGVEIVIVLTSGTTQIGVEFAWAKFGGGKRKAHIFLMRTFAFLCPAGTNLNALGENPVVRRHHFGLKGLAKNSTSARIEMVRIEPN